MLENSYLSYQNVLVKMRKILFLFLMVSVTFCRSQTVSEKMEAFIEHLFNNRKMMGSVAVTEGERILFQKSVGYRDVERLLPNTKETKFRIGSLTKTYTATLVLKAVEENLLQLNTKLSDYYPQIPNADKITIEQLLRHRSGIFNFTETMDVADWEENTHTEEEVIDYIASRNSNFQPGTKYAYSNSNYALLGFILQKIYNKKYNELLYEKICHPLGLTNTYYSQELQPENNEAKSYNIQEVYVQNQHMNYSANAGSGGIASTPLEVNKFLYALFDKRILKEESLQLMLPKEGDEYGMGIERSGSFFQYSFYGHGGRVENFISQFIYVPDLKLGFSLTANALNISPFEVLNPLIRIWNKMEVKLPNFNETTHLSEAQFTTIKGTYWFKDAKVNEKQSVTISSDSHGLVQQASGKGQMFVTCKQIYPSEFECGGEVVLKFYPTDGRLELLQNNESYDLYKLK